MAALLISENTIREMFPFLENMAGGYLLPSIREAQNIGLRPVLGDALYDKVCGLVENRTVSDDANAAYARLLDECEGFIGYQAIVELSVRVSYKIVNMGVVRTTDDDVQYASFEDIVKNQEVYQSKANFYRMTLQNFILDNRSDYPELNDNHCHRLRSQLHSMASCGVFLGGPRGKGGRKCGGC